MKCGTSWAPSSRISIGEPQLRAVDCHKVGSVGLALHQYHNVPSSNGPTHASKQTSALFDPLERGIEIQKY